MAIIREFLYMKSPSFGKERKGKILLGEKGNYHLIFLSLKTWQVYVPVYVSWELQSCGKCQTLISVLEQYVLPERKTMLTLDKNVK